MNPLLVIFDRSIFRKFRKIQLKILKVAVFIFILLLLGAAIGLLSKEFGIFDNILHHKNDLDIWTLLFLFIGLFVVLAIHELGHLAAGLIQGFRFELFVVGFIGIKRDDQDRIKLYFNTDLSMFGGMAATSPVDDHIASSKKFANVILAGPLTSLAFALFCFIVAYLFDHSVNSFFFLTGIMSTTIFFATTIPSSTGHFYTDRKRYQRLTGSRKEKDIELALLKIFVTKAKDLPINELNESEIRLITEDKSKLLQYIGYFYLYEYHIKDQEKLKPIKEAMERLRPKIPKQIANQLDKELQKIESSKESK